MAADSGSVQGEEEKFERWARLGEALEDGAPGRYLSGAARTSGGRLGPYATGRSGGAPRAAEPQRYLAQHRRFAVKRYCSRNVREHPYRARTINELTRCRQETSCTNEPREVVVTADVQQRQPSFSQGYTHAQTPPQMNERTDYSRLARHSGADEFFLSTRRPSTAALSLRGRFPLVFLALCCNFVCTLCVLHPSLPTLSIFQLSYGECRSWRS